MHCQTVKFACLIPSSRFAFSYSFLRSPFAEFHGLLDLEHLLLEEIDTASVSTLDIEDVLVHESLNGLRSQVGSEDSLGDAVRSTVGVSADDIRLNRLVLSVDQDLLPSDEWSVVDVVPTVHDDAISVELLDLLDDGVASWHLPLVLLDEGFSHGGDRRLERVTELEGGRDSLSKLGVSETLVNFFKQHLVLLIL